MAKRRTPPPPRTIPLADAISEAFSELTALGEEFREICNNTPDILQSTDLYSTRDTTADALGSLCEPYVQEKLKATQVTIQDPPPKRRGYSRADRCGQATYILQTCIDALQEVVDEVDADEDRGQTDEARRDEAQSLIDELESAKDEADGCEWPGMFG